MSVSLLLRCSAKSSASKLSYSAAVIITALFSHGNTVRAADAIVVDNDPASALTDGINTSVIAVRPMASFDAAALNELRDFHFSKDLIIRSARSFPEVREATEEVGIDLSTISLQDLRAVLISSGYAEKHLFNPMSDRDRPRQAQPESEERIAPVVSDFALSPSYQIWDPTIILNMVATGVIDVENVDIRETDRGWTEIAGFDQEYSIRIGHIYHRLPMVLGENKQYAALHLAGILDEIRRYEPLELSLLKRLGRITFGKPVVYSATERELRVPETIGREYDVYWVELAFTIWDVDMYDVGEVIVNYAVPESYIALRLVPLAHGLEVEVDTRRAVPEFSVGHGPASISVGEAFSKSVSYSYLRPTVIAFGEGQSTFAWSLRDEAVRLGTHRFVAIVGAPKGSAGVELVTRPPT